MSITFNVNEKASKTLGTKQIKSSDNLIDIFKNANVLGVESYGVTNNNIAMSRTHPLVEAAYTAYADHYPLTLTPDSVWLTIAQGFGNHINNDPEKFRKQFVSHEGKKLIKLRRDNFVKGSFDNDWEGCFSEFSDNIFDHIGKKRDMVISDFSTTTLIDKAASEIVLMNAMKQYFKYGMSTMCGIPSVTLEGTVDDWKKIKNKALAFSEFDCDFWLEHLLPVLDKLVSTAEGNPDIKFWNELFKVEGGSGGPYLSGWLVNLFPYIKSYKKVLIQNHYLGKDNSWEGAKTNEFPSGLTSLPFKWEVYHTTYDMEFVGGLLGISQDKNTLSLKNESCWAIADTGISRDGAIDPNEDW
jgi:hypothetical protein